MNIPFFPYADLYKQDKENYLRIFDEVCSRGAFILQKDLEEFEENIRNFIGVKHAFGVANGTDAIWLALLAADIGKGCLLYTSPSPRDQRGSGFPCSA